MNVNWDNHPLATHYHKGFNCYYFMQDGRWRLVLPDGIHIRSSSLPDNEYQISKLIAKENV